MEFMEFVRLVKNMRACQHRFFTTGDRSVVPDAKRLERQVDQAIREIENRQKNLFAQQEAQESAEKGFREGQ